MAHFYYPSSIQEKKNKMIYSIIFYITFIVYALGFFLHGIFFNFHAAKWPRLSMLLSYQQNIPSLIKIAKYICSFASSEILFFRSYFWYIRLRKKEKLDMLLKFNLYFESTIESRMIKVTEFLCFNVSFLVFWLVIFFYSMGSGEIDLMAKCITYWNILATAYASRFVSSDLLLLYSYVILISHTVSKSFSPILAIGRTVKVIDKRCMAWIMNEYFSIISKITESRNFISMLLISGKLLVIPLMSLTWSTLFETPDNYLLIIFKWFFIQLGIIYCIRVYLLNAYLSVVHSKSKKFHSVLCSLMARGRILNLEDRKIILRMMESITGHYTLMAYRDTYDGIVEQLDVSKSILATLEFLLLFLGFTLKYRI